jgi:hypothetical protein
MRRGRVLMYMATGAAVVTSGFASVARADDGGSPAAICADLQDGKVDGSYTAAQWNAFLHDPTVQGYCTVMVPVGTPATPSTPSTPATPATPPSAVPLTPQQPSAAVAAVKGTRQTITRASRPTTSVKGAQHTVSAPAASGAAPLATATKTSGTLPFTGAQLGLFLLAGLTLVGSGLLLRSTGRPTRQRL